ncbi:hypothetical protein DASC09_004050 [Saccharomycopsis crataegensis]|uniref:Uncharacterized protein n=1 Tax=Saccharomycopsis crataegensis TaxID=43959 RepID=A0AAV5QF99_9ASCO|nr:hypothetical protein DASC09_004050 [Saccharomycopsis crataegensis]
MDDAIGYVNKIKTCCRHTDRREQRPIQEVYLQVALSFNSAPDLLADFKKFLSDPDNIANPVMEPVRVYWQTPSLLDL